MAQFIGTNTPLLAAQTYTSKWVSSDYFGSISGSAFADQPGTLYIEQSGDLINADISASYPVPANTGSGYVEQLLLPYVRLRFTNTGSNQTVFRLYSRFIIAGMP